jgi:hypothetical protein
MGGAEPTVRIEIADSGEGIPDDVLSQDLYFGKAGAIALLAPGLPANATIFDRGPLEADQRYEWRVDQVDADGTTESDVWFFTTSPDGLPARAETVHPRHLAPRAYLSPSLSLRWSAVADADEYRVYFGTSYPLGLLATVTETFADPGPLSAGETYYWRVDTVNSSGTRHGWERRFRTDACLEGGVIGAPYCAANVNSTGLPATIEARGSTALADDCLILEAGQLPTGKLGYFIAGPNQLFIPNPGGSQGNLCVGGPLKRLLPPPLNSRESGAISFSLDLSAVPQVGAILPGETWNFQSWFRDDGSTSNFTNAVELTFQ